MGVNGRDEIRLLNNINFDGFVNILKILYFINYLFFITYLIKLFFLVYAQIGFLQ